MPLFGHGNPGTWEYGGLVIMLEWERESERAREGEREREIEGEHVV